MRHSFFGLKRGKTDDYPRRNADRGNEQLSTRLDHLNDMVKPDDENTRNAKLSEIKIKTTRSRIFSGKNTRKNSTPSSKLFQEK